MARGSGRGGGQSNASRRPVDLTGIISVAEKNDLTTLVTAITEKMHKDIGVVFDSPTVTPVQNDSGHYHWLSLPLLCQKENKENIESSSSFHQGPVQNAKSNKKANTAAGKEKNNNQEATPQLGELKKEVLAFFRKWQSVVIQRLKNVTVTEPKPPAGGPPSRGRGRGTRGDDGHRGRGGRGGRPGRGASTLAIGPPRLPPHHIDPDIAKQYPPIPNTLWSLPLERRKLFLHTVFLLILSLQEYTANSHLLLLHLTSCLNLPLAVFQAEEVRMAQGLAQAALDISPEELAIQKAEEGKGSRRHKGQGQIANSTPNLAPALAHVGIGSSQGGFGLGPSVAAGLLGCMSDNARSLTGLFGMNPSKPLSKMMEIFSREIQDFALLPIHGYTLTEYCDAREVPAQDRRLRLILAMGGWLPEDEDVLKPWKCFGSHTEAYAIRWDKVALSNLGSSLETVVKSSAWNIAKKEIKTQTIFKTLIESTWPVSLLKISKIVDNPWSVGMVRAEKAGTVLADAIMRHKFQGDRPVSLVGYSLAARAIYTCLMVLAERRQFGSIGSVVLMGAPIPSESRVWLTLKSVVTGRLVNVYSEHDYLLGFLHRFSNLHFGIAGLQEIQGADGVENYNMGDLPRGHIGYQSATGRILKDIGWEGLTKPRAKDDRNTNPRGPRGRR